MKTLTTKQIASFCISLFFATTTYAQSKSITGNGNIVTVKRTTETYSGIKCSGAMDFILIDGNEGNISLEGEENLLDYIVTEVKDDILSVRAEQGVNLKSSKNKTIKITIPFKDLNSVSLSGSGDLWNNDLISTTNFKASLVGSGDVVLNLEATAVKAAVSGSGDLTLKGSTSALEAKITGSGDFHGFDLQADHTDVSVTGSGDAEVVSNKKLKAKVTGTGAIEYKGEPTKNNSKVIGSGNISKH